MSLRLPTRTLVPVIVLAVLGGIVSTFMIARPPSSALDETPSLVRPKLAKPAPAPAKKAAPVKAKAKTPVKQPAAKPAAKPKPAPVPVPGAGAASQPAPVT